MFELSEYYWEKINTWKATLPEGTDAIDSRFTYCFTPTGIGTFIKVVDNLTKEVLIVEDGENF